MCPLTLPPFPSPCSQPEAALPLHSRLSSVSLPTKGQAQARQRGIQRPRAAQQQPALLHADTSANTGTRQARSRCCSLRSPAALPPSALPPLPIPGQGGLSTLPSQLSQPTQVGPFQRARSTRHPWSPRRPRAAGRDTGTSGAYGDSPFFHSQGRPHRPPAALPHICTRGSEPATDLCVTSERISMRKVSEHDRTKAEM